MPDNYQAGLDLGTLRLAAQLGLLRFSASAAPRYNDRSAVIQWQRNF